MSEFSTLNEIRQIILEDGDLGRALALTGELLHSYPQMRADSRLEDIHSDYDRMKDFVARGYDDPQRDSLYERLLRQLYHVVSDLRLSVMLRRNQTYAAAKALITRFTFSEDEVRRGLEGYVQDMAMISLMPDDNKKKAIGEKHQQLLVSLFDHILISPQWTEASFRYYSSLLLSPAIDTQDAELLVAAIMLSCINIFDVHKFHVLIHISLTATDEVLRQRAFVGWAFCLNNSQNFSRVFPEVQRWTTAFVNDGERCADLAELQKQVILCMEADKDAQTIRDDIMPEIMKHQQFTVDRLGIHEKDDDPMEDILHPDAADKKMEDMERTFNKMLDMQKQGSDIYFGGFSQMKRFPFFYTLSNWFMPYTLDHPALNHVREKLKNTQFLNVIFDSGPFCDSDKYSFTIALSSVVDRLPANVVEMMNSGETAFGQAVAGNDQTSPAYLRRMYLQDLYRFFRLYQQANDFFNPFLYKKDNTARYFFVNKVFAETPLRKEAVKMAGFLVRHQHVALAWQVVDTWPDTMVSTAEGVRMRALCYEKTGRMKEAAEDYELVNERNGGDETAMRNAARLRFRLKDYDIAASEYERLCKLSPDNVNYAIAWSISTLWTTRVDEGVNKLYELSFTHPDNADIDRALAWGLLVQGKPKQAENIYDKILDSPRHEAADYLNAAYSKWFQRKVSDAVLLLNNYVADGKHDIAKAMHDDADLLEAYSISPVERNIMIDIVSTGH